jgi:hypothetical protein
MARNQSSEAPVIECPNKKCKNADLGRMRIVEGVQQSWSVNTEPVPETGEVPGLKPNTKGDVTLWLYDWRVESEACDGVYKIWCRDCGYEWPLPDGVELDWE